MTRILSFSRDMWASEPPLEAVDGGFDLSAYYDAIGVVREAAHAARLDLDATLAEELATLQTLVAGDGETSALDAEFEDDALPVLLTRLRRDLKADAEGESPPSDCDPADLARLETLLGMARRVDAELAGPTDTVSDTASDEHSEADAADPALQLAEAAAVTERRDAALVSAISAGRLAIVFDRQRSAALSAQAEAAGCAPEDVVVTGLDWYLDALARG